MVPRGIQERGQVYAYTLIELLVVLAIICMLAAIIYPSFEQAQSKSQQAACVTNLKQLGIAFTQYSQDYDEVMPGDKYWPNREIVNYVGAADTFLCPADPGLKVQFPVTLSYNAPHNALTSSAAFGGIKHLRMFAAPAKTVLLLEVTNGGCSPYDYVDPSNKCQSAYVGSEIPVLYSNVMFDTGPFSGSAFTTGNGHFDPVYLTGRHFNGSNYLMCDGHVKWLSGYQVSAGMTPANSYCNQNESDNVNGCKFGTKQDGAGGSTTCGASSSTCAAGTEGRFADGTAPSATFSIY